MVDPEVGERSPLLGGQQSSTTQRTLTFREWSEEHIDESKVMDPDEADKAARERFSRVYMWIQIQSWILLVLIVCTVVLVHVFYIVTGELWNTCSTLESTALKITCIVIFHIYEIPVTLSLFFIALAGLFRVQYQNLDKYYVLSLYAIGLMVSQDPTITFEIEPYLLTKTTELCFSRRFTWPWNLL